MTGRRDDGRKRRTATSEREAEKSRNNWGEIRLDVKKGENNSAKSCIASSEHAHARRTGRVDLKPPTAIAAHVYAEP